MNGEVYVDREQYSPNTEKLTLLRYFLEPLGVSVDKWSMSVRARSATYTFADIWADYVDVLRDTLAQSLSLDPRLLGTVNPNDPASVITAVNASIRRLPAVTETPKFTDVQRIFNKACIACHNGLAILPYDNASQYYNFAENESPDPGEERLERSYDRATAINTFLLSVMEGRTSEHCPTGLMPCGGPRASQTDIETIRRWINGPPAMPFSHGDPHLRTVDGTAYDFQAAGEFTLLRDDFFELQSRMIAVSTQNKVGANPHTGLTTCVSLNGAIAVKIAGHRITYQPSLTGISNPEGMELRVDGQVVARSALPMNYAPNGRIRALPADGAIQIEGPGGVAIIITPRFWEHYQIWYLNLDMRRVKANEGVMGSISPGYWLPALPDGRQLGTMPKELGARFKIMYDLFAEAWRVTDSTSLFDYAPGMGPVDFAVRGWPGNGQQACIAPNLNQIIPQTPLLEAEATQLCASIKDPLLRANCIIDLMATGERSFAEAYLFSDRIIGNQLPTVPVLEYPADYQDPIAGPVVLRWAKAVDPEGKDLTYRVLVWQVDDAPDTNLAVPVEGSKGPFGLPSGSCRWLLLGIAALLILVLYFLLFKRRKGLFALLVLLILLLVAFLYTRVCKDNSPTLTYEVPQLEPGKSYFWKVVVEDDLGGVTESETWRFETVPG